MRLSLFKASKCSAFEVSDGRAGDAGSPAGVPFTCLRVGAAVIAEVIWGPCCHVINLPRILFSNTCVSFVCAKSQDCSADV